MINHTPIIIALTEQFPNIGIQGRLYTKEPTYDIYYIYYSWDRPLNITNPIATIKQDKIIFTNEYTSQTISLHNPELINIITDLLKVTAAAHD